MTPQAQMLKRCEQTEYAVMKVRREWWWIHDTAEGILGRHRPGELLYQV